MTAMKLTKKSVILKWLEIQEKIPLDEAAQKIYGNGGELEQLKIIRLLCAYRMKDKRFKNIRVRDKHIVML